MARGAIATRPISQPRRRADALARPRTHSDRSSRPVEVRERPRRSTGCSSASGNTRRAHAHPSPDLARSSDTDPAAALRAELGDDEGLRTKNQADLTRCRPRQGRPRLRPQPRRHRCRAAIDLDGSTTRCAKTRSTWARDVKVSGQIDAPCHGRVDALRRAQWNLIENGVMFGARYRSRRRKAHRPSTYAFGTTVPPADTELEKVFEPF